jgi:hypothetical protein
MEKKQAIHPRQKEKKDDFFGNLSIDALIPGKGGKDRMTFTEFFVKNHGKKLVTTKR